jgi:hypothetical protein
MRVTVTRSHIARGKRLSKTCCPIANAVRARLKRKPDTVSVFGGRVYLIEPDGGMEVHDLPEPVALEIIIYDTGGAMRPFAFNLPGLN